MNDQEEIWLAKKGKTSTEERKVGDVNVIDSEVTQGRVTSSKRKIS